MYYFMKAFTIFTLLNSIYSQLTLPGSQKDDHNCVLDGGYEWCESTQACHRSWESPCNVDTTCPDVCPPPPPCPLPMITEGCRFTPPITDSCGCSSGCGTVDCSTIHTVSEGRSCGGFMPYGRVGICSTELECVYTRGPYVADAPGTCQPICQTSRDNWGNCVEEGCKTWFDSCNTCLVNKDNSLNCTEEICYRPTKEAVCLDGTDTIDILLDIPKNCVTWYDGCNTCSVDHGTIQGCTLMMCFTSNQPYCQAFTISDLNVGEICYRFCEDGSQNTIDRRDGCPAGTECGGTVPSTPMISFDSCSIRAHTCDIVSGH